MALQAGDPTPQCWQLDRRGRVGVGRPLVAVEIVEGAEDLAQARSNGPWRARRLGCRPPPHLPGPGCSRSPGSSRRDSSRSSRPTQSRCLVPGRARRRVPGWWHRAGAARRLRRRARQARRGPGRRLGRRWRGRASPGRPSSVRRPWPRRSARASSAPRSWRGTRRRGHRPPPAREGARSASRGCL